LKSINRNNKLKEKLKEHLATFSCLTFELTAIKVLGYAKIHVYVHLRVLNECGIRPTLNFKHLLIKHAFQNLISENLTKNLISKDVKISNPRWLCTEPYLHGSYFWFF
jgi:hypothetical protein